MNSPVSSNSPKSPEPKKPDAPSDSKKKETPSSPPASGGGGSGIAQAFKKNTYSPPAPAKAPLDGGGAPPSTPPPPPPLSDLPTYKVSPGAGGGLITSTNPIQQTVTLDPAATTPAGVPLTGQQKAELEKIYGPGVDTSKITIVTGSPAVFDTLEAAGRYTPAYTVGNTIVVNPKDQPIPNALLVHETAHVWQYQNGGGDYFPKALVGQGLGQAYNWEQGIADCRSWDQLNPEQQAEMIQDAYKARYFETGKFIGPDGKDYTAQMDAAMAQVRAGQGTSQKWDFGW